jgi:putative FmdB family regulatory protein
MPTYEYKCEACNHQFEKFQSITAAPLKKCPKCGKNKLRRLIGTGAGLIFKGSGFYITDYRSEGYKSAEKSDSEKSKPAAETKSTESKSETPDAAAAPKPDTPPPAPKSAPKSSPKKR